MQIFSARCNIYISRLCYDVTVRLSVTEVHRRIIANLGFKFRSHFTAHCGRRAARRAACVRIISRHASQCYRLSCSFIYSSSCVFYSYRLGLNSRECVTFNLAAAAEPYVTFLMWLRPLNFLILIFSSSASASDPQIRRCYYYH